MGSSSKKSAATPNKKNTTHYLNWFEIPVLHLDRATAFYQHVFNIAMSKVESKDYRMALFPPRSGVNGALVAGPGCVPSETGPLIYFDAGIDIQTTLDRVANGGGRVVMPSTRIDQESGSFAIFIDTEGNRLALHTSRGNTHNTESPS